MTKRSIFQLFSYVSNLFWIVLDIFPSFIRYLFFRLIFKQYGSKVMIDYKCYFRYPWRVKIGNQVSINRGCQLYSSMMSNYGYITIEDHAVLGPNVTIFSAGHDYAFLDLPDTSAPVTISRYVWIGGNTTILPGVTIGEGAVIGAGSVVTKNIPAYSVAVGNPAIVIKDRVISPEKKV